LHPNSHHFIAILGDLVWGLQANVHQKKTSKKTIVKSFGFYYGLIMINPHIWWMVTHFFGISILGMQTSWSCEPIPPPKKTYYGGVLKIGNPQTHGFQMGLSENSVPLHPMVKDHYPY